MTWSARLIEQRFDAVYSSRGEEATIHWWLSVVPAGLIESRPGCCWRPTGRTRPPRASS